MRMFNLIDIGEHADSGVPDIFNVWEEAVIEENFDPDRTSLTLKFTERQAKKTGAHMQKIRMYLHDHETAKTSDIAQMLNLSAARTRVLLSEMENIESFGANRIRTYRLLKNRKSSHDQNGHDMNAAW